MEIFTNAESIGEPLYISETIDIPSDHNFYHLRISDPHLLHRKYIMYIDKSIMQDSFSSYIYCIEKPSTPDEHLHVHFSASNQRVSSIRNWLRNTCKLNGRPEKGVKSQYSLKACRSILQSAIYTCKDASGNSTDCNTTFGYSDNYSEELINKYKTSSYKKEEKRDWRIKLYDFIKSINTNGYIPLHFNGTFIEGDIGKCCSIQIQIINYFTENYRPPPNRGFMFRLLLKHNLIRSSVYLKSIGLLFDDSAPY